MDREAVWMFRDTLEKHSSSRVINDLLPSAAMYIQYAGRQIYRSRRWDVSDEGKPTFWAGELYDGLEGFCRRRWYFWKEGFGKVSKSEDLEEVTREIARKTVWLMDGIEKEGWWGNTQEWRLITEDGEC